ncbi:MAG TPA: type II secretion system protein, partial [Kofleriaceae bacterium]|nr:type II secretion system protein [Kofleriaceae bacterium]
SILAVIVLPSFFGESRKTRAFSEVQPIFNDLRIRLVQYLQENGKYPPTIGETTLHPATAPAPDMTRQPIHPLPDAWQKLKVRISGNDTVYCGYTWATGLANDNANIGPQASAAAPNGFGFATPPTDWYYLLAKCDMDGDGTVFSWYFTSSTNPTIIKLHEGS